MFGRLEKCVHALQAAVQDPAQSGRAWPFAQHLDAQPFGGPFFQLDENGIRRLVTEEPLPRFSPDGKFYLFEQRSDLWIGDLTSGETRNLTNTPDRS